MNENNNDIIIVGSFEWDPKKNNCNIQKHGISFEMAINVFTDDNCKIFEDTIHSNDEYRYYVLGFVEDVLYVVYTERSERIRIISARVATERERRLYYEDN